MKSSLLPLNPGGPSATTLQALSEYCASADSPTASTFPHGTSNIPSLPNSHPISPPQSTVKAGTRLPNILMQSSRFQSARNQILKALTLNSTRSPNSTELDFSRRIHRTVSTPYLNSPSHGLPASPNFRRSPLWDRNFGCDVSTYSTNTSSRRITPLSPLVLHPPSSPTMDVELTSDALPTTRTSPTSCMRAAPSTGTSRYPGLGYGFPRPLRDVSRTPSRRFTSGRTGTSRRTRTISNVLSASYSHTILHPVPGIKRYPDMDSEGPAHRPERSVLGHLRVAASLVRRLAVNSRERGQKRKAERVLKRVRGAVGRLLERKEQGYLKS
ncbi:hypothetical protein B0H16DRAFT_1469818 [Mycena metata]|uniref:Uncharacterized protein n=1 Tax=Mycena metata TaxID=1033252 RepID=A0AAD7HWL5_9AGAR|nr:hypothetical protein B0H16DRAFT_1469818 [Mycena metata]